MSDPIELRAVFHELKSQLRARRISYARLAERLGMSESGVKKLFRSNDCSFQRLRSICEVLDISLADLMMHLDQSGFSQARFTEEQQAHFLTHPRHFDLYWKLAYERLPLQEAEAASALDSAQAFRALRQLDELGLLKLMPQGKLRLPKVRRITDFGEGPLIEKLYRDWALQLMEDVAKPRPGPDQQFVVRFFKLKRETYHQFLRAVRELETDLLKRAIREMNLETQDLIPMRWVSAADASSFVPDRRIKSTSRESVSRPTANLKRRG